MAQTRRMNKKVNADCSTPGADHRIDICSTVARSAPPVVQKEGVAQEGARNGVRENEAQGTARLCPFVQSVNVWRQLLFPVCDNKISCRVGVCLAGLEG